MKHIIEHVHVLHTPDTLPDVAQVNTALTNDIWRLEQVYASQTSGERAIKISRVVERRGDKAEVFPNEVMFECRTRLIPTKAQRYCSEEPPPKRDDN